MIRTITLSTGSLLVASMLGCSGDEPRRTGQLAAEAPEACVDHQGFTHCALGAARLSAADAELRVDHLASADDGVAIHLPEVTAFRADGEVRSEGESDGLTVVSRSINEGVSTSTMTVRQQGDQYHVSAAFTGSGQGSTYDVIATLGGVPVGRVRPVPGSDPVFFIPCNSSNPHWPDCLNYVYINVSNFRVIRPSPGTDPVDIGACSWQLPMRGPALVGLPDGTQVLADEIELRENVPAAGSYAYASFNRIDYLADGGAVVLRAETIE